MKGLDIISPKYACWERSPYLHFTYVFIFPVDVLLERSHTADDFLGPLLQLQSVDHQNSVHPQQIELYVGCVLYLCGQEH